ncbi:NUDIX domain-containing protein [Blastococcus brunescens]|uniref:8-oxo-dGTP diphosphatase n=1 Tax=Blastococcus brunescens TaxID=1564165 RepID=A0ABZ1B8I1_9ACTN|nr:NUDIX domain-containing protein [Blastococcus sp. BMG 8361]WRL67110.1 NUDIX domain-containing protein [Blastococcus sp. BMG 8361]
MHDVVAAALVREQHVLLVHRRPDRRWYPDVWDLPGGHVEDGEPPLTALIRELHEELGVHVDPPACVPVAEVPVPARSLHLRIRRVDAWRGTPVNRCPAEHDGIGWLAADRLAGLTLADPGHLALLAGLLRR